MDKTLTEAPSEHTETETLLGQNSEAPPERTEASDSASKQDPSGPNLYGPDYCSLFANDVPHVAEAPPKDVETF